MRFLVISHAPHFVKEGRIYSYGPLVKEMVLWEKRVEHMVVFAPKMEATTDPINLPYLQIQTRLISSLSLNFTTPGQSLRSFFKLPWIMFKMWSEILKADHVHLRCPGNLALIGCFVQVLFPFKKKTAKYAGNWDKESAQPISYKVQRWMLSNTWLSHNISVMVYGQWPDSTQNIKPFFTASYYEKDFISFQKPPIQKSINLIYVGGLFPAKNPMTAMRVLNLLVSKGIDVNLVFCGDGPERVQIQQYAETKNLEAHVRLLGNVNAEQVKEEFIQAHFLIFLSDSEGWPKVVAESMSWSCVPITSRVSCVPQMVGFGERGVLVPNDPEKIASKIIELKLNPEELKQMQTKSRVWARQFTLEKFGEELGKLL